MNISRMILILLLAYPNLTSGKTVVTTYVYETQKERKSTRWTLTEWLRIKERIKLMDVWLAMFSNPKKEKFAPELSIAYQQITFSESLSSLTNDIALENEDAQATQFRGQFWFTNLVSSTTGLKMPNIDLGLEYATLNPMGEFSNLDFVSDTNNFTAFNGSRQYTCANFRIFGRNIQDSSIVLKYGQYTADRGFHPTQGELATKQGVMAGADLTFYFLSWLGIEGNYLRFGNDKGAAGSPEQTGTVIESSLFIELWNLRLNYGQIESEWEWLSEGSNLLINTDSQFFGAKLQF